MVYTSFLLQRIVQLHCNGVKPPSIAKALKDEGFNCSRVGVYKFINVICKREVSCDTWGGACSGWALSSSGELCSVTPSNSSTLYSSLSVPSYSFSFVQHHSLFSAT